MVSIVIVLFQNKRIKLVFVIGIFLTIVFYSSYCYLISKYAFIKEVIKDIMSHVACILQLLLVSTYYAYVCTVMIQLAP